MQNRLMWQLRKLRNRFRYGRTVKLPMINEKVIICGNGPSLKKLDFCYYLSQKYDFLCVNSFALDEERFNLIKPKYYCCIDPAIVTNIHNVNTEEAKLFKILDNVTWDLTFICQIGDDWNFSNPHIKTVYLNRNVFESVNDKRKFKAFSKNKATCGFQNVIAAALYFTITSCFAEVFLIGVETDFHKELIVDRNNNVFREYVHFYGKELIDVIAAGQIKKGELYRYFYFYYLTLYQYYELSKYAAYLHVKVRNMCITSFIDVFEKIDFKEKNDQA